jgi:hypothetical protein
VAQRLQRARVDQSEFCPSRHRTACHSAYAVPMDRHREPDVRMKVRQTPYGEPSRHLRDRSLQQDHRDKRHLWRLAAGSVFLSASAKTCKSGACPIPLSRSNFHGRLERHTDPSDGLELGRIRRWARGWLAGLSRAEAGWQQRAAPAAGADVDAGSAPG